MLRLRSSKVDSLLFIIGLCTPSDFDSQLYPYFDSQKYPATLIRNYASSELSTGKEGCMRLRDRSETAHHLPDGSNGFQCFSSLPFFRTVVRARETCRRTRLRRLGDPLRVIIADHFDAIAVDLRSSSIHPVPDMPFVDGCGGGSEERATKLKRAPP